MHIHDTIAVCRHCGRELRGKAYHLGGRAYDPQTGKQCPVNYFGGFVCSRSCDYNASLEQLSDMPGGRGVTSLTGDTLVSVRMNWEV
jgi:hypothetical protein